jgi:hypothetical protein
MKDSDLIELYEKYGYENVFIRKISVNVTDAETGEDATFYFMRLMKVAMPDSFDAIRETALYDENYELLALM